MKEVGKIALGVFLGGGALLVVQSFVDDVRHEARARDVLKTIMPVGTVQQPSASSVQASCDAVKDPSCGVPPSGVSVSCLIKGELWRTYDNWCRLRGGTVQ